MELSNYGVTLKRLTEDKIELVRQWRNDPKIQQYMEYREYITEEMQKNWFKKINNDNNYYFIIVYENKEIGLSNIKDLDYEKKTGESGIFIYDDYYLNSDISLRASYCIGEFFWDKLQFNEMYCHILKTNKKAIEFNKFFGYKLAENQEDKINQKYILTRENMLKYYNRAKLLIDKILKKE